MTPLTRDEEIRCTNLLQADGEEASAEEVRLLETNLHLVVTIAERNQTSGVHLLDSIQRGNEGLVTAIPYIERAISNGL